MTDDRLAQLVSKLEAQEGKRRADREVSDAEARNRAQRLAELQQLWPNKVLMTETLCAQLNQSLRDTSFRLQLEESIITTAGEAAAPIEVSISRSDRGRASALMLRIRLDKSGEISWSIDRFMAAVPIGVGNIADLDRAFLRARLVDLIEAEVNRRSDD